MRRFHLSLGLVLIFSFTMPNLCAQSSPPQVYSYTADPAFSIMGSSVVKIVRDGPRELVDQIMPVGPGRPKEFHNRILYDFQAHKIYTRIVSDPSVPCSVMTYTSPAAPAEFDAITGYASQMKELLQHAKLVGTETINGIPAKVYEVTAEQAKERVWIAEPGGFPVKIVMTGPDAKPLTIIEMKQLSFARPPASTFLPPAGCTAIQGESTATGVHAEFGTEGSSSKPTTNVTALTLAKIPDYNGPCPAHIKMVGTITADRPGKVFYQFGAGKFDPGETITFTAAGTRTVTHVMTFQPEISNQIGGAAILEAVGEDSAGKHDSFMKGSNNSDFMITCTSGGASQAPSASRPSPASPEPKPGQVTDVHLEVIPANYSGRCPVKIQLVGTLTSDGPGTAYFDFQAGAVGANREGTVAVTAAGKQTVRSEGQVRMTPQVQQVRFLAGMEPRGHQENAQWADVDLNIKCTSSQ